MLMTKTCDKCGKVHVVVNTTMTKCVECGGKLVSKPPASSTK